MHHKDPYFVLADTRRSSAQDLETPHPRKKLAAACSLKAIIPEGSQGALSLFAWIDEPNQENIEPHQPKQSH